MEPSKVKQVFIKPDESLQRDQIRTINVLRGRSKCDSIDASDKLLARVTDCIAGTSSKLPALMVDSVLLDPQTVLEATSDYIANIAPLVIHVKPDTIPILIGDGHYRSSFETNTTQGKKTNSNYMKPRVGWESECFLGLYNSTTNFERPKYGALNFLNHATGVKSAIGYGSCYMTLKPHVRRRVTLATGDTSASRCLGVLDFCNHVLIALSDQELYYLIQIAVGLIESAPNDLPAFTYREIQIHGELKLSRDIESLHAGRDAYDVAEAFSRELDIPVVWISDASQRI